MFGFKVYALNFKFETSNLLFMFGFKVYALSLSLLSNPILLYTPLKATRNYRKLKVELRRRSG